MDDKASLEYNNEHDEIIFQPTGISSTQLLFIALKEKYLFCQQYTILIRV